MIAVAAVVGAGVALGYVVHRLERRTYKEGFRLGAYAHGQTG
jgi:hypothetical protein